MKVYLINPDYMLYSNPPLGLAYISSYIKKKIPEIEIKILDQISYKKIINIIKKDKPEIVGLTSVSENWVNVKKLAEDIKVNFKDTKLVIGGVHITLQPSAFKDTVFDYGVLGEGEIPFFKLIKAIISKEEISKLKEVKGLLIRTKKEIINTGLSESIENLDEIPPPAINLLNMRYYALPSISSISKNSFAILTTRGCPYNCKFCSSSSFWESKIRFFSAKRVVEEIEYLYNKYGFTTITIADDLFAINKTRIKDIIKLLKDKNILGKITFSVCGRANLFDEEMASLLKKLGVTSIAFGFESGSEKVLKWLKGGNVTIENNKKAIEICNKYEMEAHGFFMIGSPYETLEDMEETYNFIKNYCSNSFIIYQTIAYPSTEVWDYGIKEGLIQEDMYEHKMREFLDSDINYLLTKEVSGEDFNKIYQKIRELYINKNRKNFLKNIKMADFFGYLNPLFFKKVFNLRHRFLRRILK